MGPQGKAGLTITEAMWGGSPSRSIQNETNKTKDIYLGSKKKKRKKNEKKGVFVVTAKEIWLLFCTFRFHFIDSGCLSFIKNKWCLILMCQKSVLPLALSPPSFWNQTREEPSRCSSRQVNGTCVLIYCVGRLPWPRVSWDISLEGDTVGVTFLH